MRLLKFAFISIIIHGSVAFACSCLTTGSACTALRGTESVFVGRVIEDSGEGLGQGPGKMVVEEVLHGLPEGVRELIVDTAARTSCYMRLEKGERYVIYASGLKGNRIRRNVCSFSFSLRGNAALLSALRAAESGESPRIAGKVQMKHERYGAGEGAQGVQVTAISGATHLETSTDWAGEFLFSNVDPGRYHLSVSSPSVIEDKSRFAKEDPVVSASACGYQNLYVWPASRIQGVVRSADGKPISGVPVQAFLNEGGRLDSLPFREERTNDAGEYVLSGIPTGDVVVAVNGEPYDDRLAWPPMYYPGTPILSQAKRLNVAPGQSLAGIDLTLAPPRQPAKLSVEAVLEDGSPATGAGARIENLAGIQRAVALGIESHTDVLVLPVFIGESYMVRSFLYRSSQSWEGRAGPLKVTSADMRVRVILRQVKD